MFLLELFGLLLMPLFNLLLSGFVSILLCQFCVFIVLLLLQLLALLILLGDHLVLLLLIFLVGPGIACIRSAALNRSQVVGMIGMGAASISARGGSPTRARSVFATRFACGHCA